MTTSKEKQPRKRRVDSNEAQVTAMMAEKEMVIQPPSEIGLNSAQVDIFRKVMDEILHPKNRRALRARVTRGT